MLDLKTAVAVRSDDAAESVPHSEAFHDSEYYKALGERYRSALEPTSAFPADNLECPIEPANDASPTTVRQQNAAIALDNVEPLPFSEEPVQRATFHALQEWEGYVVACNEAEFIGQLQDLTANASHEEEEATIPFAELSDDDIAKVKVGAIFRWVIGYRRSPEGTKQRVSDIVFRDLPVVTESDERAGKAWARKMLRAFGP